MTSEGSDYGHLKGAVSAGFVRWLREERGDEAIVRGLERLSDADRRLYTLDHPDLGLLPSSWYPAEQLHRVLDAFAQEFDPDELDAVARRAGDAILASVMTGLQRGLFALLMNPDRYAKYINRIWRQNTDTGFVDIESSPGQHHSRISGWKAHHPLICRMVVYGKLRIYRTMGCLDPTAEVLVCDPEHACESIVRWKA